MKTMENTIVDPDQTTLYSVPVVIISGIQRINFKIFPCRHLEDFWVELFDILRRISLTEAAFYLISLKDS